MSRDDEILQRIERDSHERLERTRALLIEQGRPDLAEELDRRIRDIRMGLDGARNCWHSISSRQRYVLGMMARGYSIQRAIRKPTLYDAHGRARVVLSVCRIKTMRALCAHELAHVDGGATDPEAKFVITERGRFVYRHGALS
jgi:hypothetical protein